MEMNEEYIDNVKQLIELKDADKVKELLVDLHPADIASCVMTSTQKKPVLSTGCSIMKQPLTYW